MEREKGAFRGHLGAFRTLLGVFLGRFWERREGQGGGSLGYDKGFLGGLTIFAVAFRGLSELWQGFFGGFETTVGGWIGFCPWGA